jgi:hypothetical protein
MRSHCASVNAALGTDKTAHRAAGYVFSRERRVRRQRWAVA